MKILVLTLLLIQTTAFGKINPRKDKAIESLLDTISVNDFVSHIEQIKQHKSVDEIKEIDYKLKKFFKNIKLWYYFDVSNFKYGLKKKIDLAMTAKEIKEVKGIFKNPFLLKVLNASILHRDLFDYNQDSVDESYNVPKLAKSRYTLVANIYNLYGMDIQKDQLKARLKEIVKQGKVMLKVLGKKDMNRVFVDPVRLEKRMKSPKEFIVKYLAADLKKFRHYELREFLRQFKHSKSGQQFLQLYANYHYLYMTKYITKVEADKINQLKALEITK